MKRPTDAFWIELTKLDESLDTLSYYQLLGVPLDVDSQTLQARYERQVRVLHPDRHSREPDSARKTTLTRVYARVGEAFRILSNPQLRAKYDVQLRSGTIRFREDRSDQAQGSASQDPSNPQARSLYSQGNELIAKGELRAAKAKLSLAKQYEPTSAAIAAALLACEPASASPTSSAKATPETAPETALATTPDTAFETAPPSVITTPAAPTPPDDSEVTAARTTAETTAATPRPSTDEEFAERPTGRVHARAPMGQSIKVACKTWQDIQTFYMHNISRGGMLLRCQTLLPIGSILELSVLTPDRESIELPAEVVRHVEPNQPGQRPGIGIRFLVIPEPVRGRFEALLKVAGLGHDEPAVAAPTPPEDEVSLAVHAARDLIAQGDYSKACQHLQTPIKSHPDDHALRSLFHLAAGLMARKRSQDDAAHSHFERALRFDPDSPLVLRMLREKQS